MSSTSFKAIVTVSSSTSKQQTKVTELELKKLNKFVFIRKEDFCLTHEFWITSRSRPEKIATGPRPKTLKNEQKVKFIAWKISVGIVLNRARGTNGRGDETTRCRKSVGRRDFEQQFHVSALLCMHARARFA